MRLAISEGQSLKLIHLGTMIKLDLVVLEAGPFDQASFQRSAKTRLANLQEVVLSCRRTPFNMLKTINHRPDAFRPFLDLAEAPTSLGLCRQRNCRSVLSRWLRGGRS